MPFEPHRYWIIALVASFFCSPLLAQRPVVNRNARQIQKRIQQQLQEVADSQPEFPADPQLLSLHKEFIAKAEKLATEYERKKQYAQAREVYESLVRLVPKYAAAEAGLQRVLNSQSLQDKKMTKVMANQLWQDSGVNLRQGMPVHLDVKGSWTVVYETGPEGIEIPKEVKPHDDRIKLGTLIGVVVTSPAELTEEKPFIVQDGQDFIAKKTGRLYLRMFDVDPRDNEGEMYVQIQSTFFK